MARLLAPCIALTVALSIGGAAESPPSPQTDDHGGHQADLEALIDRMSPDEKVAQLMMVGVEGHEVSRRAERQLEDHPVGGICLFRRNIQGAEQTAKLTRALRDLFKGRVAPFIAIDQEGGNVVRVSDRVAVLPGNMALGATRSRRLAYEAGRVQAIDLLMESQDRSLVGILQGVAQKENNNYVRMRCRKALQDMNASVETY